MSINIKATNISLSPHIKAFIMKKVDMIDALVSDQSVKYFIEVGKTTTHHKKGAIYRAEINMSIGGDVIRAVSKQYDLETAIDRARDNIRRTIKRQKEKNARNTKKGKRTIKKIAKRQV